MKVIILAGGLGTRLGKYTKDKPKCMLEFLGRPLIERQIETFRQGGIKDIIIVRKHLAEKINIPGVRYIDETDYQTHIVVGLFQARSEFNDDIIMSYGDVLFEPRVLKDVINSKSEVGVVVDTDWQEYWTKRNGSWLEDSESLVLDNDNIVSLGVPDPPPEQMDARYVGLIKFSKSAWPKIEAVYDRASKEFWDKPWYTSPSFKKAYMTDFIQALIDNKIEVKAVKIQRGWLEFDTTKDYELALDWAKQGELKKFMVLNDD